MLVHTWWRYGDNMRMFIMLHPCPSASICSSSLCLKWQLSLMPTKGAVWFSRFEFSLSSLSSRLINWIDRLHSHTENKTLLRFSIWNFQKKMKRWHLRPDNRNSSKTWWHFITNHWEFSVLIGWFGFCLSDTQQSTFLVAHASGRRYCRVFRVLRHS